MTVKECARCYEAGGLDAVWATASQKIGWTEALTCRAQARTKAADGPESRTQKGWRQEGHGQACAHPAGDAQADRANRHAYGRQSPPLTHRNEEAR